MPEQRLFAAIEEGRPMVTGKIVAPYMVEPSECNKARRTLRHPAAKVDRKAVSALHD